MREIDNAELIKLLDDEQTVIIDTRSTNAYIGWLVSGALRSGHYPGAISIAASWFNFLDNSVLSESERNYKVKLLFERVAQYQLEKASNIILYDNNGEDANRIANFLNTIGINDLIYYDFNQYEGPLDAYSGFRKLVPAEWVLEILEGGEPDYYDGLGIQIFECTWGPANITFLSGHIPTATHIDTDEFERQPEWIRKEDMELIQAVELNGIDFNKTLVLYSNGSDGAEYKIAMLMKYLGHPKVRLLNGGYPAWRAAGFPTERGPVRKEPLPSNVTNHYQINHNIFINLDDAKDILNKHKPGKLVDGRTWDEYSGILTGYKYIDISGRIPGTVWGGSYIDYKNIDDSIRRKEEVRDLMAKHGLNPMDSLAYFCGSAGWGASQIQFNAGIYGNHNIRTFEGGWNEWLLDKDNPIEINILEKKEDVSEDEF